MELIKLDNYMYKYDNKYLITISEEEDNNWINVYKKQNNDVSEYCFVVTKISFEKIIGKNNYPLRCYNNKFLLILKNKRIVIFCRDKIYIIKLYLE